MRLEIRLGPIPKGRGRPSTPSVSQDDASFSVWFPGTPFSGPPTNPPVIGPAAWAASVFGSFKERGYTFTQHTLSNFLVEVSGNTGTKTGTKTGTLTAYLNAAHVKQSGGAVTGVEVAHGTYTLQVEKIQGAWKVKALAPAPKVDTLSLIGRMRQDRALAETAGTIRKSRDQLHPLMLARAGARTILAKKGVVAEECSVIRERRERSAVTGPNGAVLYER